MLQVLCYLWQLPQNLLGLLLILSIDAEERDGYYFDSDWYFSFGVSLGAYIVFAKKLPSTTTIKHEQGHQKQSLYFGPFYLLLIGLPSLLGNLYDRLFHRKWSVKDRVVWYYNQPWEKGADRLGGVERA